MSEQTNSHHFFPKFLSEFSDKGRVIPKKAPFSKRKAARAVFRNYDGEFSGSVTRAKVPFSEVPAEKFPAVYFTKIGQHPVIVEEKTSLGYAVRLWDDRESVCHRRRLEKTLEPEGWFISEGKSQKQEACKKLFTALNEEKRHCLLGLGNGLVNASLLIIFVYFLHRVFQSAFPVAEMSSTGLAAAGIFASILSTCGFFQARFLIAAWFDSLSNTNRSREMRMPPPFPIQALTNASSGRVVSEAALAPFFLAAAALIIGYDTTGVAAWGAFIGCVIPALFFLANLPGLLDKWNEALWFFQEKTPGQEFQPQAEEAEQPVVEDDSVIRAHNLFLAHPEESRAPLLNHISLKISKNERVGFLGKSNGEVPVFLRVISGLLNSDRGLVWIDGKMVDGDQSENIGWFSERTTLLDGTLRDNICLNRDIGPLDSVIQMTGIDRLPIYRKEGLDAEISETGTDLSDEDKIRILLARSLAHQPEILVFDSPRGIDHNKGFRAILDAYLAENDCTLLLGAKNTSQLDATSRTVVLEEGKVIKDGPTDEVMTSLSKQPAKNH